MKVVLSSRGSRGDVFPIVALASWLRGAGHDVTLCVPDRFGPLAERHRVPAFLYADDIARDLVSFGSGWSAVGRSLEWFSRSVAEQIDRLLPLTAGAHLLVANVTDLGAPTVAELRGIPYHPVAFAPVIPGAHAPLLVPYQRLPGAVNRTAWWVLERAARLLAGPALDRSRRPFGLPPVGSLVDYVLGRGHVLLAISPRLAPVFDRPRVRFTCTGYWFNEDEGPLSPEVEHFLETGPPPVYFGFGSVGIKDTRRLLDAIVGATEIAGCRGIVSRGWSGLGEGASLPDRLCLTGDEPHRTLFGRVAGIVHHGGSGTVHNGARSGRPQLVLPQIADQYYWGHKLHALGLGPAPIPLKRVTPSGLASALRQLSDSRMMEDARSFAAVLAVEKGLSTAAEIVTRGATAAPGSSLSSEVDRPAASCRG